MSAISLAGIIRNLSRQLAESLRSGDALVSDARAAEHHIREAEGWLQTARRFLDPADPLGRSETGGDRLGSTEWAQECHEFGCDEETH